MTQGDSEAQLFAALAEELKLPLMQIGRMAELHQLGGSPDGAADSPLPAIQMTADMSLQLLDSYLLSLRLSLQPATQLALAPVSVSAVLHDSLQQLSGVAAQYGVSLDLHIRGRYQPVLTHRQALQSAMVCLGYALIEALPAAGSAAQRLQLATHRTKYGIVAGVYGEFDELTPRLFRQARQLQGRARQPLVGTLPGSGAGVFVADAILKSLASCLRVGRYGKLPGFAVTLPSSEQLQLV